MTKLEAEFNNSNAAFLNSLPNDFPKADFSEEHKRAVEEIDKNFKAGKYKKRFSAKKLTIILVAAALIAIMSVFAFSTGGQRQYILEKEQDYYHYDLEWDGYRKKVKELTCDNIPEGYNLVDTMETSMMFSYVYQNESGIKIIIEKSDTKGGVYIDNHAVCYDVVENEIVYTVFDLRAENDRYFIVWNFNDYIYTISGGNGVSLTELIDIAKSTK